MSASVGSDVDPVQLSQRVVDAHTVALFELLRARHVWRSAAETVEESHRIKAEIIRRRRRSLRSI